MNFKHSISPMSLKNLLTGLQTSNSFKGVRIYVIEKSKSSIEYDIAEKLESLKDKIINQKNKKVIDVKNKLEK